MHKLNSKFIDEYQYGKLRRIVQTFLACCFKVNEMKTTNNIFKDCHVILSSDVVNVKEGKFRDEFIDSEDLSVETRLFRNILLEELKARDEVFLSVETQTEWLRNIQIKFASGFGNCSSKKGVANMWPIALISPKDVELFKRFSDSFILASNQPNDEELTGHIRAELKNRCSRSQIRLATDFLQNKLRTWFKTVSSEPLNSTFLKDALKYINNNEIELEYINETKRNIQALSPLQLEFETIPYEEQISSFLQQKESSLLHIETNCNMKMSLMKLFHCLQKLQFPDYFFSSDTELSRVIDLLEVFGDSETFNILIIELRDTNKSKEKMRKVQNLIQTDKTKRKKLIVVTKKGEAVFNPPHPFLTVKDETFYDHLTTTSRQQLLDRKITFQGGEIAINSILSNGIPLNHQDMQLWGCLMEETISINSKRDDIDLGYYINRTLQCECHFDKSTIQERLGYQHIVTYNLTDFNREVQLQPQKHVHRLHEMDGLCYWRSSNGGLENLLKEKEESLKINDNDDNFLDFVKETLIISDPAGNGKSTITSYLATELMKKNGHFWVTRLPSSRCSFNSEEIQLTAASDNVKYDLFLMEKLFEISLDAPLERLIFEQYLQEEEESQSKLIFIFDGLDEINEESRKVIIRASKYLKEKPNVKFIGISTRPQHQQQLEEELLSRTWTLQPFNENNKITFLEKFWSSRARIEQCNKMREYAEQLIDSISRSISEKESELTGIPLQMRMIGEIYEESLKEFVAGDIEEEVAFPPIDLFGLYEQFIKKKEDVYLNDKLGINKNAAQRSVTIKPFQKKRIEFALKIMLASGADNSSDDSSENLNESESNSKLPLLEEDLEDCIGLGIIQKSGNNEFSFIHRTFAEFLTAKYLLDASVSLTHKLKKGQLMRVLTEDSFSIVRKFVNSKFDSKQMVAEFTKPENEIEIRDITRQEFLDANKTLLKEKITKVFLFLMELLLFRIKGETGLRSSYGKRYNRSVHNVPIFIRMLIKIDNDCILESFKYLVSLVLKNKIEELATCLIECQKRLEENKIILNNIHLESILFALNPDDMDVLFSFEYFRYLKHNKRDVFYAFLKEKGTIQKVMLEWNHDEFKKYRSELYQLMDGDSDATFILDHFVDGVGENIIFYYADQFEAYLKFIGRYTRFFDRQKLKRFQLFLEKLSGSKPNYLRLSEIFLKFAVEHRDLFSIDVIIQNISFFHENLSLIENCALWGWTDILKLLLDVIDSEVQSERRRILASIRERHSDEQLMKIAISRSRWKTDDPLSFCQFLSNAIRTGDELNLEVFTSWITTEELFISFLHKTTLTAEVIEFIDERYPQYMVKCFKENKRNFLLTAAESKVILEILGNDQKINHEEFWEIMNLKNPRNKTILYNVCRYNKDSLKQWLKLLKKKCSNSGHIEQLYKILKPVLDKRLEFEINIQEKLLEFSNEMNFKDYHSDN